jgi:hypothetical protein
MGAMRRVLHRRALAAIGAAGTAVVGVAACEPTTGGLSAVAVAITTDRTGTSTLERLDFDVRWLSCTATVDGGERASASKSPASRSVATVDCQGETDSGQDITLKGKVTEERSGRCVRGDLIARVDGKVVFQASMLGDCAAGPTRTPTRTSPERPQATPPGPPPVTVTVTVTATATPDSGLK